MPGDIAGIPHCRTAGSAETKKRGLSMKKNTGFFNGIIIVVLLLGMVSAGCDNPSNPADNSKNGTTTYTVSFEAGSGSGTPPANRTVDAGTVITLPNKGNLAAPGNESFIGWKTGGVTYSAGDDYTVTGNVTFIAQWEADAVTTYTVTYYANGASGTVPATQTPNAGSTITIAYQGGLSYSGKTFTGWNTAAGGTGIPYTAGSQVQIDANLNLYAQWITPTPVIPAMPTGLSTRGPSSSIYSHEIGVFLSWTSVTGAAYYNIYWDSSASGSFNLKIGTSYSNSFNDTEELFGTTTNYYKVSAVNSIGQEGPKSNSVAYSYPTITQIVLSGGAQTFYNTTGTYGNTRYFFITPVNGTPYRVGWLDSDGSSSYTGDVSLYTYWADTGVEITTGDNHSGLSYGSNPITIPANNGGTDIIIKVPVDSSGSFSINIRRD
jgi:uncharacterized repeat protein (TIGR02543 family)